VSVIGVFSVAPGSRRLFLAILLPVVLCVSIFVSVMVGYQSVPGELILRSLVSFGETAPAVDLIVWDIRLPRGVIGALVGGALGMAGAALQGLLRNPLADPGLIGVSQCAALGAITVIYFGLSFDQVWTLPAAGMMGALLAAGLMQALAGRDAGVLTVILAGVAVGSLASALMALAMNLSPNLWAIREITFWLMGSLKDRSNFEIVAAAPFILTGMALLLTCGRGLEALSLGEETATSLGINLPYLKMRVVLGTALAVGASVAVAGSIAFVGLIVPHLFRPLVGHRPAHLLWASGLAGAVLVVIADLATRLVPTNQELHLGVVTALIGAPFFLALILRTRRMLR
jgi:iron complex transport system permease protein